MRKGDGAIKAEGGELSSELVYFTPGSGVPANIVGVWGQPSIPHGSNFIFLSLGLQKNIFYNPTSVLFPLEVSKNGRG